MRENDRYDEEIITPLSSQFSFPPNSVTLRSSLDELIPIYHLIKEVKGELNYHTQVRIVNFCNPIM